MARSTAGHLLQTLPAGTRRKAVGRQDVTGDVVPHRITGSDYSAKPIPSATEHSVFRDPAACPAPSSDDPGRPSEGVAAPAIEGNPGVKNPRKDRSLTPVAGREIPGLRGLAGVDRRGRAVKRPRAVEDTPARSARSLDRDGSRCRGPLSGSSPSADGFDVNSARLALGAPAFGSRVRLLEGEWARSGKPSDSDNPAGPRAFGPSLPNRGVP